MKNKIWSMVNLALLSVLIVGLINNGMAQTWTGGPPTSTLGGGCTTITGFSGITPGSAYTGALQITSPNGYGYIQIGPQNSTWCHIQTGNPYFYFNKPLHISSGTIGAYNSSMYLQTTSGSVGTTRMILSNSNGYVGVGNFSSAPTEPFHVYNADANGCSGFFQNESGHNSGLLFVEGTPGASSYNNLTQVNDNGIFWTDNQGGGSPIQHNSSSGFVLAPYVGSSAGIRIASTGNVGIGVSSPSTALEVAGNVTVDGNFSTPTWTTSNWREPVTYGILGAVRGPQTGYTHVYLGDGMTDDGTNTGWYWIQSPSSSGTGTPYYPMSLVYSDAGFNAATSNATLSVSGTIKAYEVKVCLSGCDFVFGKDYKLRSIEEVDDFIQRNQHLPEIASAAEMQSDKVSLGELDSKLLQKVEELTLYIIQQQKEIKNLNEKVDELSKK